VIEPVIEADSNMSRLPLVEPELSQISQSNQTRGCQQEFDQHGCDAIGFE
jgi:hypothetical protein